MARQPILNRDLKVFGYELLFRNGAENYFRPVDGDLATRSLISDVVHLHDIESLSDGRKCFINFTRNALLSELYTMLPPPTTVVEILETVELDAELLVACRRVRNQGYTLALDDYVLEPRFAPLLPLIDLLKVEFPALTDQQHHSVVESARRFGFELLAEKVETPEQYDLARQHGYHYFQGYFFCKPQMLRARRLPQSRLQCLRLLQLIGKPEFDIDGIEDLIRGDLSMTYKLLRYLNSPVLRRQNPVNTVRQAITTLGQQSLLKWVSLIALNEFSGEKPSELMTTCLVRARFCELVGERVHDRTLGADCFMVGMFSLLDAMLDQPMSQLIKDLSFSEAVRDALLRLESPLLPILELGLAMENGDWPAISRQSASLVIAEAEVFAALAQSIEWSTDLQRATTDSV